MKSCYYLRAICVKSQCGEDERTANEPWKNSERAMEDVRKDGRLLKRRR